MTNHLIKLSSGDKIAYWTHHSSKKPTLILVHGFTGSHEGFQYLIPLLKDFHLIIPDLPGFGISPLPHDKLTLAELGKLFTDFIAALDLDNKPYLLGHSMGSLVVSEAVRQQPDLFAQKIILISPVPSPIGMADLRRAGAMVSQFYYAASHRLPVIGSKLSTSKKITRMSTNMIMTARDKKLRRAIHEHHFGNLNFISNIGWYSRLYRQINRTGISRYKVALEPFDVLLVNGERDSVTPLSHQRRAAHTVRATLKTIPGVGHLAHYEKPRALVRAIVGFLR